MEEIQKPKKVPSPKRRVALVRRVQRLGIRIGKLADAKRTALEELQLAPGATEVDGDKFVVLRPEGQYVYNAGLKLIKLPKKAKNAEPPVTQNAPQVAATAEAGV